MNVYQIVTDKIIADLNKGVVPWRKPWTTVEPRNIKGRRYNGINRILLSGSPIFVTFKQCNEYGGSIKKGAKSSVAVFWNIIKKEKDGELDEFPMLRYYNVFSISDTTINPEDIQWFSEMINKRNEPDKRKKIDILMSMMRMDLPEIRIGSNRASYDVDRDSINMPIIGQFESEEEYISTLVHELIHSTGHPTRLNRVSQKQKSRRFGDEEYSFEELVAEIGSAFLLNQMGCSCTYDNSLSYIQGWVRELKNDPRMIISAASKAEKAVKYLIGETEDEK